MSLWRNDASFVDDEGDEVGCVTIFTHTAMQKAIACDWLSDWDFDVYEEPTDGLSEADIHSLVAGVWPTLPLAQILALAKSPKIHARRQLNQILARKESA